jgi:hypothetical protein
VSSEERVVFENTGGVCVSGAAAPAVRATYRTIEREPFDRAATSVVA